MIISISNFKGGVGKTTSTANIGACLANSGKRVLLIDLDPQHNLTQSLGVNNPKTSTYQVLTTDTLPAPLLVYEGLHIIPSELDLMRAEIELSSLYQREMILQKKIKGLEKQYDYILIDCPPSLGLLTINAFVCSDFIFVPIEAEYLALKGYSILNDAISRYELDIDKVFITKFDGRKILNKTVKDAIFNELGDKAFKTVIRQNVSLAEAPMHGQDIFSYDPHSYGAFDYKLLTSEILSL